MGPSLSGAPAQTQSLLRGATSSARRISSPNSAANQKRLLDKMVWSAALERCPQDADPCGRRVGALLNQAAVGSAMGSAGAARVRAWFSEGGSKPKRATT
mmetsp:Transcript_19405/g.45512  ORF Transcript_19405/g.45512 Transcript_19405/m.45512 type:complete len:100 (+) Transcript_19405:89-388(+)